MNKTFDSPYITHTHTYSSREIGQPNLFNYGNGMHPSLALSHSNLPLRSCFYQPRTNFDLITLLGFISFRDLWLSGYKFGKGRRAYTGQLRVSAQTLTSGGHLALIINEFSPDVVINAIAFRVYTRAACVQCSTAARDFPRKKN